VFMMFGSSLLLLALLEFPPSVEVDASTLVSKLGSTRFADREAAARALEGMGREAVVSLRAARFDTDPEVRTRAADLLERIERTLLVQPTPIALDFTNRPLAEVVQTMSTRAGMPLALDPDENDRWLNLRTTLVAEKPVPFWTAVDRLCAASPRLRAGLGPPTAAGRGSSPSILLFDPGERARPPAPTSDSGPFRVKVVSLHYQRDRLLDAVPGAGDDLGAAEQFQARLQVLCEPRLMISQGGGPRILEAVDDAGQSLRLISRAAEPDDGAALFSDFGMSGTVQFPLALRYPDRPGRVIKRLRGVVPVTVSARKPDPIVARLVGATGKTFLGNDASLVVRDVKSDPNESRITLVFSVQPRGESAPGVLPSARRARMFGLGGEFSEQQFEVLDARGKPLILLMQEANPEGDSVRLTLVLAKTDGAAAPALLKFYGLTRTTADVDFAFQDIPMP
jgi:hypothetical protein